MIKFFIRNARRNKLYYGINLIGLVLGATSTIFIFLYLQSELTYDSHYSHADRIYRVALNRVYPNNEVGWASIPAPVGPALQENFPEMENVSRMMGADVEVTIDHHLFIEKKGLYADPDFFRIFDLKVLDGDIQTALSQPRQLVLTEKLAMKYFKTTQAVGKQLAVRDSLNYQVSAVIQDLPDNSHFEADLILPMQDSFEPRYHNEWGTAFFFFTYVKLKEGIARSQLESKARQFLLQQMAERTSGMDFDKWLKEGNSYDYFLQPLTDIHLTSNLRWEFMSNGNKSNVQLFLAVGIFIIIISCINYINLSTAKAGKRMKELGLKKIMGASRFGLVRQLLVESVIVTLISGILALLLSFQILPFFNELSGKLWDLDVLIEPLFLVLVISFSLILGVVAGIYPALKLSSVYPTEVIGSSTKGSTESAQERWIRNILVGLQFGVSLVVIVSTLVVYKQNEYLQTVDLGYDKENLLVIENAYELNQRAEVFKNELVKSPHILQGTGVSSVPGFVNGATTYTTVESEGNPVNVSFLFANDEQSVDIFRLSLLAGRNYRAGDFTDTTRSVIINEEAMRQFGWTAPEQAIEASIKNTNGTRLLKVIGVVQDFHIHSLHEAIRPLVISTGMRRVNKLVFKIKESQAQLAVDEMTKHWNLFSSDKTVEYSFLDSKLETLYESESHTQELFSIFTLLAIFLAGFGMYGLSAYLTELKRKEVAIRKTLGASELWILKYFTFKQLSVMLLSVLIGLPIAHYLGNEWLSNFAYRIEIGLNLLLISVGTIIVIGLVSIGWYSVKAALENPVNMLRE
ncbi:putative ABC transport system permease protein [Reichenbachiella faecimaris]|uniref:Putative ABC transport system permease protein n=1 Tax=Reichenbachiella faecimaris TaxID=692418 RepID=A0A1W2GCY4_REIFA|nr:ABC transporter permease [Reichenbachiella faecimaris]SMD34146.1 putative ABC transport system permease protein [Reichenbachiella faecimaris]